MPISHEFYNYKPPRNLPGIGLLAALSQASWVFGPLSLGGLAEAPA
jgi:hypothetical protein